MLLLMGTEPSANLDADEQVPRRPIYVRRYLPTYNTDNLLLPDFSTAWVLILDLVVALSILLAFVSFIGA